MSEHGMKLAVCAHGVVLAVECNACEALAAEARHRVDMDCIKGQAKMMDEMRALIKRCADALGQYRTYREDGCLSCDGDDPGEDCTCGAVDIPMHVERELRNALKSEST